MDGYLKGTLTADERELLQRWYDSFGESEVGVEGLEDEHRARRLRDTLDARIKQAMDIPSVGTASVRRLGSWRRIAAAAVLILAFGGIAWFMIQRQYTQDEARTAASHPVFHEVKTDVRQVKKLVLPDGSTVHVNANTTIRIPERMDGDKRELFLDEGEAYFEVARDTLRPFVVQVSDLHVEVLGTAFNVRSYSVLEDIVVTVNQGKVRVSDTTRVLGELAANEGITYHKTDGKVGVVQLELSTPHSWIGGEAQLQKARFDELALAMYNLYGVRLNSDHPRTIRHRYNLKLRADRSLEETMGVICRIHKTTYRRTGNEITIYP